MAGRLRGRAALAALGEVRLSDEDQLSLRLRDHGRAQSAFLGSDEPAPPPAIGRGFWLGVAVALLAMLVLGVVAVVEVTWAKQQQQQRRQQHQTGAVLPPPQAGAGIRIEGL